MDSKIYYQDAYIKTFTATVTKKGQDEKGNWYVVMNRTAFYPTGGGQPYDTGMIGEQKVTGVEEVEGEIRHYLEGPLEAVPDAEVTGAIDWERRFDHMQQHSGQHILSAAFDNEFHYKTVSFHLGNETLTIDIQTEKLTEAEAEKAEELANQIIIENRPIETKWVSEEELSDYSLRKETKVKENIRLVIIPEFDYNGCGGTHPKTTGEVQGIKILNWEKQKKNIRVEFVCGGRVLKQLHQKQKVLLELTRLLNSPEKNMPQAVSRLLESGKQTEKTLEQAREQLLQFEAKGLLDKSKSAGDSVVACIFENRTIQELQKLARFVIAEDERSIVFFVSKNDSRLQLVCARGTEAAINMKKLIADALKLINGKGGGNDSFAQGGGEALISAEEMIHYLEKKLLLKDEVSY